MPWDRIVVRAVQGDKKAALLVNVVGYTAVAIIAVFAFLVVFGLTKALFVLNGLV